MVSAWELSIKRDMDMEDQDIAVESEPVVVAPQEPKYNRYIRVAIYSVLWSLGIYLLIDDVGIKYALLNIPLSFIAYFVGDLCKGLFVPGGNDGLGKKIILFVGPHITFMIAFSVWLYWYMYEK